MKKRTLIAVLALLGVSAAIGTTVAFLSDSVNFNNDFHLAEGETEFVETFKSPDNWKSCDTTQKELVITNKSDVPVVARFKMEEYWKRNGSTSTDHTNEISPTYQGHKVAVINFQNQNDWEQKGEWYVYKNVLQKNQPTSSLLASVTFNCDVNMAGAMSYSQDGKSATTGVNDYANAHFHLNITAQTLQSDRADSSWSIATFNRKNEYSGLSGFLTSNERSAVKTFVKSNTAPDENATAIDVTGEGSDKPIMMWLSSNGETLYWYSEANEVYLPSDSSNMLGDFRALETTPGLAGVNTSKVTSLKSFFEYDQALNDTTPFANWDVSHVTDFSYMFFRNQFTSLAGLSNWDMSSAMYIQRMLSSDHGSNLQNTQEIAGWNVSNVVRMELFMSGTGTSGFDASSLEIWDISKTRVSGTTTAFDSSAIRPTWAQ